jgi:hypothetical protein
MSTLAPRAHRTRPTIGATTLRRLAAGTTGLMAVIYLLIFAGILSIGEATTGDLGILGVAGLVFVGMSLLLCFVDRPLVVGAVAAVQVPVFAMYLAIAPERDPSFELWGVSLRVLQVVLVVLLLSAIASGRRDRREGRQR